MSKVDNTVRIPTSIKGSFFKCWLEFLAPLHHLTPREIDVASAFLKQRYELGKVVSDPDLLDKIIMSEETKAKVREDCNISAAHFQVIMGKLRKNNVIKDNKINQKLIPKFNEESNNCLLLICFDLDTKRVTEEQSNEV